MFNSDGTLDIFEDFLVDRNLPKHQQVRRFSEGSFNDEDGEDSDSGISMKAVRFDRLRSRRVGSINVRGTAWFPPNNFLGDIEETPLTWLQRLLIRVIGWVSPPNKTLVWRPLSDPAQGPLIHPVKNGPPEITVQEFFSAIKNSTEELAVVDGRVRGYEAALERAHKTGQVALAEQLVEGIDAVRSETQLHALGLTKVLTEATLVEFVKKSPRGLRLDWVQNFTRVIPDDVLATKVACDERGIFDNYVVLHYDPNGKSWADTQAQREARKDPILFGVLAGRRVLYFVGDWIDEFCDLTLDQIADVLGREPSTLDPESFDAPTT